MPAFDVVDLPETDHVEEGDRAPEFVRPLVTGEYWEDVSLSELAADTPLLLIFYPMDGAFPATYIWNEIRDRGWGADGDVRVAGLSISTPYEHAAFLEDRDVDYPLYSDPGNAVAAEYGIVNDLDGMAGIEEPRPAAFLLATDRTVEYAWVAGEWPEFPDYDEIEDAMERL